MKMRFGIRIGLVIIEAILLSERHLALADGTNQMPEGLRAVLSADLISTNKVLVRFSDCLDLARQTIKSIPGGEHVQFILHVNSDETNQLGPIEVENRKVGGLISIATSCWGLRWWADGSNIVIASRVYVEPYSEVVMKDEHHAYQANFRKDGTVVYKHKGKTLAMRMGAVDFKILCQMIEQIGFRGLESEYMDEGGDSLEVSCLYGSTWITVLRRGKCGPIELQTIEQVIKGFLFDVIEHRP